MECEIQNRADYSKELLCYKAKVKIRYYSKLQMKALYPHKNFWVAGEIGGGEGIMCGAARNTDGQPIPVYREKSHNRLTEAVIGYAAIDNHTYLAVIKNVLLGRVLTLTLIFVLLSVGVTAALKYCMH